MHPREYSSSISVADKQAVLGDKKTMLDIAQAFKKVYGFVRCLTISSDLTF
jgi:hypothetical protein